MLQIVDGHATLEVAQESIRVLRYTLVRPIAVLEVQDGGPVVGEVLRETAGCASCLISDITAHRCVERISANDLMDVSGWDPAWLYDF